MPRYYESYIDEDNNKKLMKCIKDYLNGNETQLYYCEKHDVNYHAFKRHFAKYKDKHSEEMKQIVNNKKEKNSNKDNKIQKYESTNNKPPKYDMYNNKLPNYDTSTDKVFKKHNKQNDVKSTDYMVDNHNNSHGGNHPKYERVDSKISDAGKFFAGVTELAKP
jgi:hypothetical protein